MGNLIAFGFACFVLGLVAMRILIDLKVAQ